MQTITATEREAVEAACRAQLWRRGELRYRLREHQRPIYDDIRRQLWGIGKGLPGSYQNPVGQQQIKYTVKCHRRFGKSALCAFIVNEMGQTKPHARMSWAAETATQVEKIIIPNMRMALRDCPEEIKPVWKNGAYRWPHTGAVLYTAGCEDERKADRLLGDASDLFILDEAGSIWPLEYVYKEVVLWMGSDRGGVVLMPSTPAKTPAHYFRQVCIKAKAGDGGYAHRTVHDSEWDERKLEMLAAECGGVDTSEWKRQALAEDVIDEDVAVLPEATRFMDQMVEERERPRYYDIYAGMDIGDAPSLTAIVYGYYDFGMATLVLEGEDELSRPTSDAIADAIATTEQELWGEYFEWVREDQPFRDELARVYLRVSDNDPILLRDLAVAHELEFGKAQKDHKEAAIGKVRRWIKEGRIKINPRCKRLLAHMEAAIWNKQRTKFEFMDGFGHFDFVDALVYLVRAVDEQHDPTPPVRLQKDRWVSPKRRKETDAERMKKLFGRKARA